MPMMVGAIRAKTLFMPGLRKARRGEMKPKRTPVLSTEGSWQRAWAKPPIRTPTAMARAGLAVQREIAQGTAMKQRLKSMGA